MKLKLLITIFLFSGLITFDSCDEKFSNPSPEAISESQANVSVKLKNLPDGTEGKNGVLFVLKEDEIFSNKSFIVEKDLKLKTYMPELQKYSVMAYILNEDEWDPKDGFDDGWYSKITDQSITPEVSELNLITKSWGNSYFYCGNIENIIECNILRPVDTVDYQLGDIIKAEIEARSNDQSLINSLSVFLDNNLVASMTDAPYYIDLNTNDIGEGEHNLRVLAENANSDMGIDEVTFYVMPQGSTAPDISFAYPENNGTIERGYVQNIRLSINDYDGEIVQSKLYIDGTQVKQFEENEEYIYRWKTENYDVGTHEIKATAEDNDGNERSRIINFSISETDAPIIYFNQPAHNEEIYQGNTYSIQFHVSDPQGIQDVNLYIDGASQEISNSYGDSYSYQWNTSNYSTGEHTIEISASDEDYNYRSRTIKVFIINQY